MKAYIDAPKNVGSRHIVMAWIESHTSTYLGLYTQKIREIFSAIPFVAQKNDRDIANEWGSVWRVAAARRIVQTVPQTASQRWSGSETSFLKFYDTESATNKSVHKDNVLLPPIWLIDNIAKGTTDPSVECYCQITALRYRKILCQFDQNLAKRSCQDS